MIGKAVLVILLLTISTSKLYQVVSLARHGARYHVQSFYDGDDTKPLWGELTAVGMRQHQRFGQLLRKQYIDSLQFLSPKYNSTEMEVISTPTNRTMTSIQSMMYGLYPAGTGPRMAYVDRKWHLPPYSNKTDVEQQNYAFPNAHQPIRVKVNEKVMLANCPKYDIYEKENFQAIQDVVDEMTLVYYPFMKRMSTMFNFSMVTNATFLSLLRSYDAVTVDKYLGRPVPNGFTDDDYDNLEHLANWFYYVAMANKNGYMANTLKFQRIINLFDLRTRLPDTYPLKWSFWCGHDTDIIAMHLALNISSANCTEQLYRKGKTSAIQCEQGGNKYVGNVIIELHSNDGKNFFVKVRSNGKYMRICVKNTYECDYLDFKALVRKSMTTDNMDELCGKTIKQTYDYEYYDEHHAWNPLSSDPFEHMAHPLRSDDFQKLQYI